MTRANQNLLFIIIYFQLKTTLFQIRYAVLFYRINIIDIEMRITCQGKRSNPLIVRSECDKESCCDKGLLEMFVGG